MICHGFIDRQLMHIELLPYALATIFLDIKSSVPPGTQHRCEICNSPNTIDFIMYLPEHPLIQTQVNRNLLPYYVISLCRPHILSYSQTPLSHNLGIVNYQTRMSSTVNDKIIKHMSEGAA